MHRLIWNFFTTDQYTNKQHFSPFRAASTPDYHTMFFLFAYTPTHRFNKTHLSASPPLQTLMLHSSLPIPQRHVSSLHFQTLPSTSSGLNTTPRHSTFTRFKLIPLQLNIILHLHSIYTTLIDSNQPVYYENLLKDTVYSEISPSRFHSRFIDTHDVITTPT